MIVKNMAACFAAVTTASIVLIKSAFTDQFSLNYSHRDSCC